MNVRVKLARISAWSLFRQAAAMTTGVGSALHNAATAAAFGRDPGALKFSAIAARLPSEDRRRLWDCIAELDAERVAHRRAA